MHIVHHWVVCALTTWINIFAWSECEHPAICIKFTFLLSLHRVRSQDEGKNHLRTIDATFCLSVSSSPEISCEKCLKFKLRQMYSHFLSFARIALLFNSRKRDTKLKWVSECNLSIVRKETNWEYGCFCAISGVSSWIVIRCAVQRHFKWKRKSCQRKKALERWVTRKVHT